MKIVIYRINKKKSTQFFIKNSQRNKMFNLIRINTEDKLKA